jgi:hypothetical protein
MKDYALPAEGHKSDREATQHHRARIIELLHFGCCKRSIVYEHVVDAAAGSREIAEIICPY